MKTNHHRKNKSKGGHDYSSLNFMKRLKVGLGMDHDGGHRGSARDIREAKTHDRRKRRRIEKTSLIKESKLAEI